MPLPAVLLAALSIIAQLLLATVPLWHHHEHEGHRHACPGHNHDRNRDRDHSQDRQREDCTVCLTVALDKTDGPPPLNIAPETPRIIGCVAVVSTPDRSVAVLEEGLARGPPIG